MWSRGTKLISETSPELGVGVVLGVDGDYIDVFFPDADKHLRLSASVAGIEPIELGPGDPVRLRDGSIARIRQIRGPVALLTDGSRAPLTDLWPHLERPTLVDHLANCEVNPLLDVLNRVDGQRLLKIRERTEIANLIGARVELVPREIATAKRISNEETVRWALAGEPGTGRMTVSCMVVASMVRRKRAERVVIVAPHRRAIRWLGDLYQKFHQVFVHIDAERWRDIKDDVHMDANPFDVHPLSVVSSGLLASEEVLLGHLRDASPDLVILDEAHHAFTYVRESLFFPLLEKTRHALLLTGPPDELSEELFGRFVDALGLAHDDTDEAHVIRGVSTTSPGVDEAMWSFPDSHDEASADGTLDPIAPDFDETLRRFCLDAAERVELDVERKNREQVYYFEYGPQVKVEALPGLTAGARFLGTFDRRTALADESLEFFACGHPLVEGLLAELQLSARGRVGAVRLRRDDAEGFHGLYLLVVEGRTREFDIRVVPLMDASGAAANPADNERKARELYASLDMGIELEPERVEELMGRVANHPLLEGLDARTLSQVILVAVMD